MAANQQIIIEEATDSEEENDAPQLLSKIAAQQAFDYLIKEKEWAAGQPETTMAEKRALSTLLKRAADVHSSRKLRQTSLPDCVNSKAKDQAVYENLNDKVIVVHDNEEEREVVEVGWGDVVEEVGLGDVEVGEVLGDVEVGEVA